MAFNNPSFAGRKSLLSILFVAITTNASSASINSFVSNFTLSRTWKRSKAFYLAFFSEDTEINFSFIVSLNKGLKKSQRNVSGATYSIAISSINIFLITTIKFLIAHNVRGLVMGWYSLLVNPGTEAENDY